LPWLVACIKDKNGKMYIIGVILQLRSDLLYCDLVYIVSRLETTDLARSSPTVMSKAHRGNPMVGPTCHDRLPSRMKGQMRIKGTFRAGFRITSHPDAGIHRIDWLPAFQWILSQECFDCLIVDLPLNQGVVDAAPASLKTWRPDSGVLESTAPVVSNA